MPKRKKDSDQGELPIEGAVPVEPPKKKKATEANGNDNGNENGAQHVIAEAVENIIRKPFDPRKRAMGLHTRVDRGFLEYASYVI
ncbi:MAG TPA: hypothetical protein VMJ12_13035, partial [Candidatus Acidoferrales bacterium]|nr:hypothetical protein [Candidatus Acidoferrales bacterium]